jgi:hypothetical protein
VGMVSSDGTSPCITSEEAVSTMMEGSIGTEADDVGACNDAGDAGTVGRDDVPVEARSFMVKVPLLGNWPPSLATPSA